MAVEGVNNNSSNAGLYAGSGVVLGAGAGVGTAYLTKPYLKNGAPTDEFVRKIDDKMVKYLASVDENSDNPTDLRAKKFYGDLKGTVGKIDGVKDVDEARNLYLDYVSKVVDEKEFGVKMKYIADYIEPQAFVERLLSEGKIPEGTVVDLEKASVVRTYDDLKQIFGEGFELGKVVSEDEFKALKDKLATRALMERVLSRADMPELTSEIMEKIENVKTYDGFKQIFGENFDSVFKDKSIEEVKTALKSEFDTINKNVILLGFEECWDADNKALVNCDKGINATIKKAARSIQGKYALIYGICAGAALGVVGYLAGVMGGNKADDAVAQPASSNAEE